MELRRALVQGLCGESRSSERHWESAGFGVGASYEVIGRKQHVKMGVQGSGCSWLVV